VITPGGASLTEEPRVTGTFSALFLLLGGFVLAAGLAVATKRPRDIVALRVVAFVGAWLLLAPVVILLLVVALAPLR
jgi:hypothetical protein